MSTSGNTPAMGAKPASPEPIVDRSSAHIGIVCTHRAELKPFLKRVDRQKSYTERKLTIRGGFLGEVTRIVIAEAGEGFARHREATEWLLTEHRPSWVVSAGFSSSLSSDISPGDLVVANELADTHTTTMPVKCSIAPRKRIHVGKLLVADQHPVTPAEKSSLQERFPALAVDTSSLAVAQVCHARDIRFLAIRAIVDGLEEQIPEQAFPMIFHPTSRALGSALGSMFQGLRKMSEMNMWRERTKTAAVNLDRFLTGVVEQVAEALERQRLG